MILDIVQNLVLYVEPVMRDYWERVDRMRFALRLTSADDAAKHRQTLANMQNNIRDKLTNMRQLERQLFQKERVCYKVLLSSTVVRLTDGREVGGSIPASVACLAESCGLETAPYLYLVLRYFGTISVMYANDGCITPKCSKYWNG